MAVLDAVPAAVAAGFRRLISGESDGQPPWVTELEWGSDVGYFGPGSAAWQVHGGLPTLVGGVRALLLQALHPAALAGVQQHSRYEDDALGRLSGTTQWLTVVTFGDTQQADRECARVRGMHRKVVGQYDGPDGPAPYAATDPELLRWVHVAFTDSFLATHRAWGSPIRGGEDAYVREWALAGEAVGVTDAPRSVAELTDQIHGFDHVLRGDDASARTVRFIRRPPLPWPARGPYAVLLAGAIATLREDHRRMLGLPPVALAAARPAVSALLSGMRAVLGPTSPAERAARRRISRLGSPGPSSPVSAQPTSAP